MYLYTFTYIWKYGLNSHFISLLMTQMQFVGASLWVQLVKNLLASAGGCRRCRFDSWVGKIPWSRKWQPTPVFLPGKFHGQRSLAGYSLWGHKESDMAECTHTHTHTESVSLWHCRRTCTHTHTQSLSLWHCRRTHTHTHHTRAAALQHCWVFVAACGFSLVALSGSYSRLGAWASRCRAQALELRLWS